MADILRYFSTLRVQALGENVFNGLVLSICVNWVRMCLMDWY